jgi:protein phosphatase
MMNNIHFFGLSEKGHRDSNEDAYCSEKIGRYFVFAVADGLGGHAAGEVASSIAVECVKEVFRKGVTDPAKSLENAVFNADTRIRAQAEESEELLGMATTLIAACVDDQLSCVMVNVGDSRGHLLSCDGTEVTKDHGYVQELLDAGEISADEAWHHPLSNVLRQALGDPDGSIKPDFYTASLLDTYLLLSTDGLHDYVRIGRIREIIFGNGENLKKSCESLAAVALENDSDDNITVVLVHAHNKPN